MTAAKKRSVLFVCTGNSARSQMAEALLKQKAGEKFAVFSAGTAPEPVDPQTIEALAAFGVQANNLVSKNISEFADQTFDYVITLCHKATDECVAFQGAEKQLAWDFPDPKSRDGANPYTKTLQEISNRIAMFLLIDEKQTQPTANNLLAPKAFFKCLSDDIRLNTLMLVQYFGELCVCELMHALHEESQPKVSRNLAVLRKANILTDRKTGQWVYYKINPQLNEWMKTVIAQTTEQNTQIISPFIYRLNEMKNRPDKRTYCK
jgi:ArsR family transcriptional regulator